MQVEPVAKPQLGQEQPADLKRLEWHRSCLNERLPLEHPDNGVNRVLLILERGVELELHHGPGLLKPS